MSRIYNNITCTRFRIINSYTRICLCITCTRKAVSEVRKYLLCKSGTVNTVCQTVSAVYIRITDKLFCISYNRCACAAVIGRCRRRVIFLCASAVTASCICIRCCICIGISTVCVFTAIVAAVICRRCIVIVIIIVACTTIVVCCSTACNSISCICAFSAALSFFFC